MRTRHVAAIWLVAGLTGGFALSAMFGGSADDAGRLERAPDEHGLLTRIDLLESRLAIVVEQTANLADRLDRLDRSSADLHAPALESSVPRPADAGPDAAGADAIGSSDSDAAPVGAAFAERVRRARRAAGEDLAEQLTEAGFSEVRAQQIERRVEELRVEAMQSRYEAMRSDDPQGALQRMRDTTATLREELGDADYERFLDATGRPTRVAVGNVLASSAAETAGLQPGDQIVAYAGQRVFDIRELNRVLMDGEAGEPVIVDVERDGQPIQIVIPRGPLGISSGFRGRFGP